MEQPTETLTPDHQVQSTCDWAKEKCEFIFMPEIKIQGRELLEYGFIPGKEVVVHLEYGKIVVTLPVS